MRDDDPEIPERFEIREELHRSAQTVRLRAFDRDLEQEVVLEFPGAGARALVRSSRDREDLLRQARMRARVEHPKIQPLKEFLETDSAIIHVLQARAGDSLEEVLCTHGCLTKDEVIDLGIDLADALSSVHEKGVVHRGVAAHHILMAQRGKLAVLTGFTFAKPIDGMGQSSLIYAGEEESTTDALPHHPAPEQVSGHAADARSDVFAVGCVLYEALTARPAFADRGAPWIEPKNPAELVPDLPDDLAAIILRCLRQSPLARFNSMRELGDALTGLRDRGASSPTAKPGSLRNRIALVVLCLLAIVPIYLAIERVIRADDGTSPRGVLEGEQNLQTVRVYKPDYDKLYALLIGIDYRGQGLIRDLEHPERDVKAMAENLSALGFEEPIVLLGDQATAENIEQRIFELEQRVQPDDQVFLYFAGHGKLHSTTDAPNPPSYLLPADARPQVKGSGRDPSWMPLAQLQRCLDEFRAKHMLVAIDCCYSGAVFGELRDKKSIAKGGPTARGYDEAFLRAKAKVIMVSCTAGETAADASVFAKGILEKLRTARTDPVTHTQIQARIETLGANQGYQQVPMSRRVYGSADFVFLNRRQRSR